MVRLWLLDVDMSDIAELLKMVRRIEIVANRTVNDLFSGQYKSVFRGRGMEFSEVREYQPGDDIRTIDWNVTARAGRPYIKRFVEERELTVLFLVDVSASGVFGSQRSKLETAVEIAATLMFSALKNNDKVGLVTFADQVLEFHQPRKGKANVLRLIRELLTVTPVVRPTNLKTVLDYVNRIQKRRAVVFLLSDFLVPELIAAGRESGDETIAWDPEIAKFFSDNRVVEKTLFFRSIRKTGNSKATQEQALSICNRKHDLIAMTISDPREHAFPNVGFITLRDAETGELVEVDTANSNVRRLLAEQFRVGHEKVAATLRRCQIDRLDIGTGEDFVGSLRRFFHVREQRLR